MGFYCKIKQVYSNAELEAATLYILKITRCLCKLIVPVANMWSWTYAFDSRQKSKETLKLPLNFHGLDKNSSDQKKGRDSDSVVYKYAYIIHFAIILIQVGQKITLLLHARRLKIKSFCGNWKSLSFTKTASSHYRLQTQQAHNQKFFRAGDVL